MLDHVDWTVLINQDFYYVYNYTDCNSNYLITSFIEEELSFSVLLIEDVVYSGKNKLCVDINFRRINICSEIQGLK